MPFPSLRPGRGRDGLVPLDDALAALGDDGPMGTTTDEIPLAAVVGSVARPDDYDDDFRPRKPGRDARRKRVREQFDAGSAPPPIEVVQVGEMYFVADGHHRVSVARELGWDSLSARVRRVCTVAFARACLRVEHLASKAAERRFLDQVPLPDDVRETLWLDRPADWSRLADAALAWGYRAHLDGDGHCCAHDLAAAWWRSEVVPVVERRRAAGASCSLADVQVYVTALAERDAVGELAWADSDARPHACCH